MVTKSENHYRSGNRYDHSRTTKAQRTLTMAVLRYTLKRPPLQLEGESNGFVIELHRHSAGVLDGDNLRGALKAVRDAVAAWIGIDDRDRAELVTWRYGQRQAPRGEPAVCVQVTDRDEPWREPYHRVLSADTVAALEQVAKDAAKLGKLIPSHATKAKPKPPASRQARLPLLRVYAVYPWEQPHDGDPVLVSVPSLERATELPTSVWARVPAGATGAAGRSYVCRIGRRRVEVGISEDRIELHRHPWRDDDGADAWVYLPADVTI